MTTAASTAGALPARQEGYPAGSVRFDLAMIVVSAWLIGGLFVDGWAHFHGMVDDSFFTPWHAIFYSGFMAVAVFLGVNQWRNIAKGYAFWRALPEGYALSLVGAGIFAVGGVGDLIWHTLFGIEVDTEALLSPTHLLLATGMALIISGPLRAAWRRIPAGQAGGWRTLAPMILSATLLFALLAFFTSYANPFITTHATQASTASTDTPAELYVMNADGTGQTRLTMTPGRYGWLGAWSPDGSQIVYSAGDMGADGQGDLYVMDADGSDVTPLTDMDGEEYTPSWSPDGERVVFVNRAGEQADVYVISRDGGEPIRLTETVDEEFLPVWSPDGTTIALTVLQGTTYQVYTMNADGSDLTSLTSEGLNWGGAWSPDGEKLAFASNRDGNAKIYIMDADGGNQIRLTSGDTEDVAASWSEQGIVFTAWRDDHADIYRVNADGSALTNLTYTPSLDDDNASWSPDGNRILYTVTSPTIGGDSGDDMNHGITSILIQSALMMALVLPITRRWTLPFGALTLMFTLTTGLISVLTDQYALVSVAFIGGLISDGLVRWLKPTSASVERYYLFAFLVPAIFYALYFGALQLMQGISWTIHVWAGAIFLAGVVGLLLSVLITWAQESRTEAASPRAA
jgi:Tol biopolymer transport system component